MKLLSKTIVAGLVLVAGMAFAKDGVQDPTVKARQELMGVIGMNTKILGDMAGGKTGYDAAAAEGAKAALIAASAEIAAKFEPQATDPMSDAKPEIWTSWDDFVKNAGVLNAAATAIDVASVETIGAGMGGIGGACKDCHTTFRK